MPGLLPKGHILRDLAITCYEKVRGNPQVRDPGEVWVGLRIERVAEQSVDAVAAVLAWWQADVVNHQ